MLGHSGQGLFSGRSSGGRGRSSYWSTSRAPWRWTVPRQSAPVSPPPRMITRLSFAETKASAGISSPSLRRFWGGGEADGGAEDDAFGIHLGQPPVQVLLLHLELGDAVAEEAADPVRALEHGDGVAGAGELLGASEAGGPGADDGDGLAGEGVRGLRVPPPLLPGPLDDGQLDLLDGDGVVVDPQDAGRLAGGGAEPAGEVREVVGGVQPLDRLPPLVPVYEIVPVG